MKLQLEYPISVPSHMASLKHMSTLSLRVDWSVCFPATALVFLLKFMLTVHHYPSLSSRRFQADTQGVSSAPRKAEQKFLIFYGLMPLCAT